MTIYFASQAGFFDSIFVKNLDGKTLTFNQVSMNTNIGEFKKMMRDKSQFNITDSHEIRLIYGGKQLRDGTATSHSQAHFANLVD
jgi:hypothetical protein